MPSEPVVRVLIAEPNDLHAAVLTQGLPGDRFVVDRYAGPSTGLARAASSSQVVVVGPTMPRHALAAVVPDLLQAGCRMLVISADRFDDGASDLLYAGATGFLSLTENGLEDVADAVLAISRGSTALNPDVVQHILTRWRHQRAAEQEAATPVLTEREHDVLAGLCDGLTTRLLAKRLGVAEKTIEAHKSKLFTKLGARNQAQAVRKAMERGLV